MHACGGSKLPCCVHALHARVRACVLAGDSCWGGMQAVLTDAVYSGIVGRPMWWRCLEARVMDKEWETRPEGGLKVSGRASEVWRGG